MRHLLVPGRGIPKPQHWQQQWATRCAHDWGAELIDAGNAGHLDTSAGYGPWPHGERLVEQLGASH